MCNFFSQVVMLRDCKWKKQRKKEQKVVNENELLLGKGVIVRGIIYE